MDTETLRLAKQGLAELLAFTAGVDLAPNRLAVIEAAKYGIKVAENYRNRKPRLTPRLVPSWRWR